MNASAPRRRRRRVLALGPIPEIADDGGVKLEPADSLFDVLGLIATCPAREPIEAIVMAPRNPRALHEIIRSTEAIRRIDPTVQILLLADEACGETMSNHVDRCISGPLDADRIERMLDGDPGPPPPSKAPAPPEKKSHDLIGDADLLEAILSESSDLISLAVRAIEQRTGFEPLLWSPGGAGGPEDTPVRRGLDTWGSLRGGPESELAPWASWLARWIALDSMVNGLRLEARRDHLTGAWNRRSFERLANEAMKEARSIRQELTVFVFDIDGFKLFNDRFGHAAGDTILISMVRLLSSVIREGDHVGRLGGDEFAVLFADFSGPRTPGSRHPDSVEVLTHRFQQQITDLRFPELGLESPGRLSISGGLASFPWDGDTIDDLLRIADQRALESKRRGKNCLTFGPDD